MTGPSPEQVTLCLRRIQDGERGAVEELVPHVYAHLRGLAARVSRDRGEQQTLQPTALVHEAYLRLAEPGEQGWADRQHFFRVAAIAMRQILTDHARARGSLKRGGSGQRVQLDEVDEAGGPVPENEVDLSELNEALDELRALDDRQADIVEMRFLTGLTVEQVAEVLGLSERMVYLDWKMARHWLQERLARN